MYINKMLTREQVQHWREKGWVILKKFIDINECQQDMKTHYPIDAKNPIQDFGSGGATNFPCTYNSLNKITVNVKLINAVKQLLNTDEILLTQSVAWAKYYIQEKNKSSSSNHDQRIHMDYGNNYWTHPPKWDNPNMVAAIMLRCSL